MQFKPFKSFIQRFWPWILLISIFVSFAVTPNSDVDLLRELRSILTARQVSSRDFNALEDAYINSSFPKNTYGFILTLFQPGLERLMVVSYGRSNGFGNVNKAVTAALRHPRIKEFELNKPDARIQIDFIREKPWSSGFRGLSSKKIGADRFEMGIDGLHVRADQKETTFLPGNAFVQSLSNVDALKLNLARRFSTDELDGAKFHRFRTESYVSFENQWIRLRRGVPQISRVGRKDIEGYVQLGVNHVLSHQKPDGQFMEFEEAMGFPPRSVVRYSLLNHANGASLLLEDYATNRSGRTLAGTRLAIDFLVRFLDIYEKSSGVKAAYIKQDNNASLGASAMCLYVMERFRQLTGDQRYANEARMLVAHLMDQILPSGEFLYFYKYDGHLVDEVGNSQHFNFYYPGEALLALSQYYKNSQIAPDEKISLELKIKQALDFLLNKRPEIYSSAYTLLTSDAWMTMAINELWDMNEFKQEAYRQFVFDQADNMVSHMYTKKNALYPDYIGGFYGEFGEQAFFSASHGRGLLAAYELAEKSSNVIRARIYVGSLKDLNRSATMLVNMPEAVYLSSNPQMTLGAMRFRLCSQWFNIDTTAHLGILFSRSARLFD